MELMTGYTLHVGYFTSPPERRDQRLLVSLPKDTGNVGY